MSSEILKRDQNHITVLGGITDDADQDVIMLRVDPISKRLLVAATGGGGGYVAGVEPPVGTVDGSNTVFTVSNTPKYIISDGITLFENNGYTLAALTITMTVPPQEFIRSFY
jgi:hypothetical protein